MINCIIVEDELPAREELKYFLNEEKEIKLIEEFESPLDTLNFLEKNKIDFNLKQTTPWSVLSEPLLSAASSFHWI